jgi:tryptophan-rich sensory protein
MSSSKAMKTIALIGFIALPLIIGFTAGIATASGIGSWYSGLTKPWFNPPNYLFGPVWTILYTLMGIGSWMIWKSNAAQTAKNRALMIYGLSLTLNFVWSFLFFYFNQPLWALIEIAALWLLIVWMIKTWFPIKRTAALIQIPYLLWVSFATILNAAIVYLN